MATRYFGQPVKRNEDARLLTGQATFTDDVHIAGMLTIAYVVFKNVFEADRRERLAMSQWEAAHHDDRAEADPAGSAPPSGESPEKS